MPSRKPSPDPFNAVVDEIRHLMVDRIYASSLSDDTDMYYVGAAGFSPMERLAAENAGKTKRAEQLVQPLVEAGPPAASAVARGLRMQGSWREMLLPYVEGHREVAVTRAALELVAQRRRDPLAPTAKRMLAGGAPP
jgi:hypothetical protein